jgi:hypothetical protein
LVDNLLNGLWCQRFMIHLEVDLQHIAGSSKLIE